MALPPDNQSVGATGHTDHHNAIVDEIIAVEARVSGVEAKTTIPMTLTATSGTQVPLTVKGATGQSADILDVKDTAGTVLVAVDSNGELRVGPNTSGVAGAVKAFARSSGVKGLIVRGYASQAVNLADFQNSSGTTLAAVANDGTISAPNIGAKVIVLGATGTVPGGTASGTVILRRP